MITHPAFAVEPWSVREAKLDLDVLPQTESVFALANGHIGLRANLDEGEPYGLPGTYLNSFYELRPLPYAEAGYGYPESGQTVVNVTNGKIIRLLVDDEPFDVRYGRLLAHERILDLRAGVLRRRVEWTSPAGAGVRVCSTRLVSFVQRSVAAILYEVEPLAGPLRVVIQSELVANEPGLLEEPDPRAAAALESPLESEEFYDRGGRVLLVHSTKRSKLRMAAGMDHVVDALQGTETAAESRPDVGRFTVAADLADGERLRVVKFLAYGWSSQRSAPAVRDQVVAALTQARHAGWEGLLSAQRTYLDDFWESADVELEGDSELQQAVRFALFHTLQAGARAEQRAIAAKGLTGPGYDGHTFWDTERFVLPVLTYTAPRPLLMHFAGATQPSIWRANEPASWDLREPPSRGARSAARNARATGPLARPRSTSLLTWPTRSAATGRQLRTTSLKPKSVSSSSWRPPAFGARSAITIRLGDFASTV
jgi:alpha,alpha-trehalose phosphorylase